MSEPVAAIPPADAVAPAAADLPTTSVRIVVPPPDPWPQFLWRWFVRGWRPFCGWALGLIALSEAVVRVWQITHGLAVSPVAWAPLTAFGATLIVARSYDKREGTA